jgi:SlyX protein
MEPAGIDTSSIHELEARLAQQDHSILELSDEVYQQQQKIAELELKLRHLTQRLEAMVEEGAASDPAQEIPPHY